MVYRHGNTLILKTINVQCNLTANKTKFTADCALNHVKFTL